MQHLRRRSGKGVVALTGSFLLINPHVAQLPASPVGLGYIGEALVEARVPVRVLNLAFETDWKAALVRELIDTVVRTLFCAFESLAGLLRGEYG